MSDNESNFKLFTIT